MNVNDMGNLVDTHGQYWDMQAVSQVNIQSRLDPGEEQVRGQRWTENRLAVLSAGRRHVRLMGHTFVERKIQEVDPNLRLRYELHHPDPNQPSMYAVDRYVRELGYFWTICYWSHTLGEGLALRQILLESDMQRPEYHNQKKLTQELILEQQAKLRENIKLAAWDQLTKKQAEEFIQVQIALQTGEKIVSTGKDAEILNRMYNETMLRDRMQAQMANDLRLGNKIVLTDYD